MSQRRSKVPRPRLQMKLILMFLSVALCCVLLQFNLLGAATSELAMRVPGAGLPLGYMVMDLMSQHLLICLACLVPLTLAVGIAVTFRIAGPLHRFEQHLRAIGRGEDPGPCHIRKGDELGELCEAINLAVNRLRSETRTPAALPVHAPAQHAALLDSLGPADAGAKRATSATSPVLEMQN